MYSGLLCQDGDEQKKRGIPELGLCEDTNSWPNGCWHLPGHVLDRGMGFLMGR